MSPINEALLQIVKRAERLEDEELQRTFVDFGSVLAALSSIDHQIVFGRRGTGKTHLLTYLRRTRQAGNDAAIQIDMRNMGSNGGIYNDQSLPVAERATRLLIDTLAAVHQKLLELADNPAVVDLGQSGDKLNALYDVHGSVKVVGTTTSEAARGAEWSLAAELGAAMGAKVGGVDVALGVKETANHKGAESDKVVVTGTISHHVNFGNIGDAFAKLVATFPKKRLWIYIDEWSEIPLELQPMLADLFRRAFFPVRGVTVKIAAIEQRTRLRVSTPQSNIGLELGSDVSPAINLDDYMVFDNDDRKAVSFFKSLVLKHVQAAMARNGVSAPQTATELISQGFTQTNAFEEVVRACEGVPRDAIHILGFAAQRAGASTISVQDVRTAAKQYYQSSKDPTISSKAGAKELLQWIVDQVIGNRQTKAFLLESSQRDALIDFLYDERVLHVLKKGLSAQDQPGKRFNVYGIDYGCYVDLINTQKAPRGYLDAGTGKSEILQAVPVTDLRSVRRCILDLGQFHSER